MHDLSMLEASMLFITCMSSSLCQVTCMYAHAQLIAEGQNWRECSSKVVGTLTLLRWRSNNSLSPRRLSMIQIEGSQRDSSRKSIIGTMLRAKILTLLSCMHIYMCNMHACWICHTVLHQGHDWEYVEVGQCQWQTDQAPDFWWWICWHRCGTLCQEEHWKWNPHVPDGYLSLSGLHVVALWFCTNVFAHTIYLLRLFHMFSGHKWKHFGSSRSCCSCCKWGWGCSWSTTAAESESWHCQVFSAFTHACMHACMHMMSFIFFPLNSPLGISWQTIGTLGGWPVNTF